MSEPFSNKKNGEFSTDWAPATPEFLLPVASPPPSLPALPSLPSPLALLSPSPWLLQLRAEAPLHSGQGGPNSVGWLFQMMTYHEISSNIRLVVSHLIPSVEVIKPKVKVKKRPSTYLGLFHQRHQISFLCDGARHTDTTAVEELLQLLNASKTLSDTWPLKMSLQSM